MMKHIIIQLDDTSVSFCHYSNNRTTSSLMPLGVLKDSLLWSMKHNVSVQILYPDYMLPSDYWDALSNVYRTDIVSSTCNDIELRDNADVVIFDSWANIDLFPFSKNQAYVIRSTFFDLFENGRLLNVILPSMSRINIMITDLHNLSEEVESKYSIFLENLSDKILKEYKEGHAIQVNLLTDRILLDEMNNCGAGVDSITLAPDGQLYICPGFYLDNMDSVGDLNHTLNIPNQQLYDLSHAPICRICDAWQCKRCIWENKRLTLEVNTPGREQCVTSHIERNASRNLLSKIRELGTFMPNKIIPALSYIDPFELILSKREEQE